MPNTQAPEDLCVFLIRRRLASYDQVASCMREWQEAQSPGGSGLPIHQLLLQRDAISEQDLGQQLREQSLRLTYCPSCGKGRVTPTEEAEQCTTCNRPFEQVSLKGDGTSQRIPESRYRISRQLGAGSMGVVYQVSDEQLGREVAIKTLSFDPEENPAYWKRFQREGRLVASIRHPNVVRVLTLNTEARPPYLVMELVKGQNLEEFLSGPFDCDQALEIVSQSALGVAALHEAGIIHRDLKPANILLDQRLHPKVTDFGFARLIDQSTQLTNQGQALGTPYYMAPEQMDSVADIGQAADVYALGIILYRALAGGRLPFEAKNLLELFELMLHAEVPSPRERNATVSGALEHICVRATRSNPAKRYPTAASFRQDLQAALDDPDLPPSQLPFQDSVLPPAPENWKKIALYAALALMVTLILMYMGTSGN